MRVTTAIGWGLCWASAVGAQENTSDMPAGVGKATSAPEQKADGARAAELKGNPGIFFGADAYPPEALRDREQGRVVAKLEVGRDGRVADCTVAESSGSTALDVRTCVIAVSRITFTPARDDRGRTIASSYTLPVRWVLPEAEPAPRKTTNDITRLVISADNRLIECKATINGVPASDEKSNCERYRRNPAAILPFTRRDLGGRGIVITTQHLVQFSQDPAAREEQALPGHMIVGLTRLAFDILPDGSHGAVQVVEQSGRYVALPQVMTLLGRFEPAIGRTDKVRTLSATSYELAP